MRATISVATLASCRDRLVSHWVPAFQILLERDCWFYPEILLVEKLVCVHIIVELQLV
jgi:hypothetical protein